MVRYIPKIEISLIYRKPVYSYSRKERAKKEGD